MGTTGRRVTLKAESTLLRGVIIRKMSTLSLRQRYSRMYVLTDRNSPHTRYNCFVLTKFREWKGNHESWIIVTKHARIIIRVFGADNPLFSLVTCYKIWYGLIFSFKRTPYLDKTNDNTESVSKKNLNAKENRWSKVFVNNESGRNSCRNRESLRQKRLESWISRFKWFSFHSRPSWPDWASQSVNMERTSSQLGGSATIPKGWPFCFGNHDLLAEPV